jgi:hypothetical protein
VHPAVSQLLVQQEMVQLLCLQLACVVQQMQESNKNGSELLQRQLHGNSPAQQLLAAIGVPAGFYGPARSDHNFDVDQASLTGQAFFCLVKELDRSTAIAAESGSAGSAAEHHSGLRQLHVAASLSLVLLQLCGELAPSLRVLEPCLQTVHGVLVAGLGLLNQQHWSAALRAAAAGTSLADRLAVAAAAAAAAEGAGATDDHLGSLLQCLLHIVGLAMITAVRKLDTGWSEEEFSQLFRTITESWRAAFSWDHMWRIRSCTADNPISR